MNAAYTVLYVTHNLKIKPKRKLKEDGEIYL